jgi:3'-phosphoadenosine 5'-phosphosulfate (PAPS) 3'-phosphatase
VTTSASGEELSELKNILVEAVLAGAARVLAVRAAGSIGARYKDSTEVVTEADRASDAAMLEIFRSRCPAVNPEISFHLEESGVTGAPGRCRIGADPLDGTSHFASGGTLYSVQAHYIEDGAPLVGVVFQPEAYRPLEISPSPQGRLVWATRGGGAFVQRSERASGSFQLSPPQAVRARPRGVTRNFLACVPITGKMSADERALARRVHDSGLIGGMTGTGGAGGNVLWVIFGGHDVYANFGAGEDLDLAPPQVIAQESGLTVWAPDRRPPVWHVRKQPVIVAPSEEIAELFLRAAGL